MTVFNFAPRLMTSVIVAGFAATGAMAADVELLTSKFQPRVVASDLAAPWELTYGPDDQLWVTERAAARISRVDPATGAKTELFTFKDAYVGKTSHEGLLGMALDLDHNQVFAAYTYNIGTEEAPERRMRVSRLSYDGGKLADEKVVIEGLIAGDDHNAGRLKIGPDGMLYLSQGDHGANQFGNFCKPIKAQDLPTKEQVEAGDFSNYQGKVLRITPEGAIPTDNPELNGVRSHVFTYGHRNPQGLVFSPDGHLFQSEQGPKSDDEVNILQPGGNYGWPHVAGYRDDQAYVYGAWAAAPDCASLTFSDFEFPPSVPQHKESDWTEDFVEPLKTFYTVENGYNYKDENCGDMSYICWPTIAPASIDYYASDAIPGWKDSLLVASLKNGAIYRMNMNSDGKSVQGDVEKLFNTQNRYRDLAISPDGKTIFVATEPGGNVRATAGGVASEMANPGSILAFTYAE